MGLAVDDEEQLERLIRTMHPTAAPLGKSGRVRVLRCEDPSGARLIVETRNGRVEGFVPSFAGTPGVHLADLMKLSQDVWKASVFDESGDQVTSMTLELEQGWLLNKFDGSTSASLVALGVDVKVHADEAAFAESDASLMGAPDGIDAEPPAHFAELGLPWPPRMAPESFISYGVFGPPLEAVAQARLNGVVLRAERRRTAITDQEFLVLRVSAIGMEIDMCLAGSDHPDLPLPGQIVAGTVFLIGSLDPWPTRGWGGWGSRFARVRSRMSRDA